ncbi:MAG: hypothetical protein Greene101449_529, partial [Candidatus Peregrinibacteria bacterium Greene1014_49]
MSLQMLHSPGHLEKYDRWVKSHPNGTLWQSLEWKTYQEALGREVRIYTEGDPVIASALVVIDRTIFSMSTWDMPRGPLEIENGKFKMENFLGQIAEVAKSEKCMSIFLSPVQQTAVFNFPFSIFHSTRAEQPR